MEELRKQQAILGRQQVKINRLVNLIGIGIATVIVIFAVTITYIVVVSRGNKEAYCTLIETNRAEKRAQLRGFEETPPTTEVGRNLEGTYRDSLAAWDRLWDTVGCKAVKEQPL